MKEQTFFFSMPKLFCHNLPNAFFQASFQLQVGKHQVGKKVSAEGHLLWGTLLIGEVIYRFEMIFVFSGAKKVALLQHLMKSLLWSFS